MGNIVETAKCRFCGQMTQIEADEKLTAAQAEEQATMTCNCTEAVEYHLHRRTCKGHIEPPRGGQSINFTECKG